MALEMWLWQCGFGNVALGPFPNIERLSWPYQFCLPTPLSILVAPWPVHKSMLVAAK